MQSTRFGNFAMEKLINELLKAGCSRNSLEIKVFGGGNVTDTQNAIGTDNSDFILRYLEARRAALCRRRICGGQLPRRIHYTPTTGKVIRRSARHQRDLPPLPRGKRIRQPSVAAYDRWRNSTLRLAVGTNMMQARESSDCRRFRGHTAATVDATGGGPGDRGRRHRWRSADRARPDQRHSIPMSSRLTSKCRTWTASPSCARSCHCGRCRW